MYRCVNSACGRGMPRPVAFCPYCGTRQAAAPAPAPAPARPAPAAAVPLAAVAAPPPAPPQAPVPPVAPVAPVAPPAQAAPPPLKPKVDPGPKPLHIPPMEPDTGNRTPSPPPRQPIRMRTWLVALVALVAIWLFAKPGDVGEKNADRVDAAVALAGDCKMLEARAELAALKSAKAAPAQLKRLQSAISETTPGCEKKRLRAAAWNDTRVAVEAALDGGGSLDKAAGRLAAFTRRWDADADTRELSDKIEIKKAERLLDEADACLAKGDRACLENRLLAAERLKRPELSQRTQALREALSRLLESSLLGAPAAAPAAAPPPAVLNNEPPRAAAPAPSRVISTAPAPSSQTGQQVRKILSDAERELAQGNYRGAIDKLDICATMIDVGNRDCLVLKQRAERLNRDMLRCVAGGADWVNDRCN